MKISLKDIYIEFFLIGVQLLGGGYVILPLMQKSIVEKRNWITSEDLTNFFAMSQTIPGIVAANISIFTGYRLRGKLGAMMSLLGVITSPIISILLIATIIDLLLSVSFIQSIFWGVGIAVIILVYLTIKEMWKHSLKDAFSWFMFLFAFITSFIFRVSPVKIIIAGVIFGVLYCLIRGDRGEKEC